MRTAIAGSTTASGWIVSDSPKNAEEDPTAQGDIGMPKPVTRCVLGGGSPSLMT